MKRSTQPLILFVGVAALALLAFNSMAPASGDHAAPPPPPEAMPAPTLREVRLLQVQVAELELRIESLERTGGPTFPLPALNPWEHLPLYVEPKNKP